MISYELHHQQLSIITHSFFFKWCCRDYIRIHNQTQCTNFNLSKTSDVIWITSWWWHHWLDPWGQSTNAVKQRGATQMVAMTRTDRETDTIEAQFHKGTSFSVRGRGRVLETQCSAARWKVHTNFLSLSHTHTLSLTYMYNTHTHTVAIFAGPHIHHRIDIYPGRLTQ